MQEIHLDFSCRCLVMVKIFWGFPYKGKQCLLQLVLDFFHITVGQVRLLVSMPGGLRALSYGASHLAVTRVGL